MESIILAIALGVAITIVAYEMYFKMQKKQVGKALAPKLQTLIEESSKEIIIQRKRLDRDLTSDEKDEIFDECYRKM